MYDFSPMCHTSVDVDRFVIQLNVIQIDSRCPRGPTAELGVMAVKFDMVVHVLVFKTGRLSLDLIF